MSTQPNLQQPERLSAAELRAELRQLHEQIDALAQQLSAIADGLTATAASAAPRDGEYTEFVADQVVVDLVEGKTVVRLRGERYRKFGVRIWPEVIETLAEEGLIIPTTPGTHTIPSTRVRALLSESGQPRKIVGLA